ncbi:MAG TPA: hypothetical protein VFV86_06045 [Nitrososphaeraceae archaeon]|nr:hypothetical protein [Nitrososphaeraceae archaeon]
MLFPFVCIVFLLFGFLVSNTFLTELYGQQNGNYFTVNEKPYNKTFSEWATNYWDFLFSFKNVDLIREGYTPAACTENQDGGPIWYLIDGSHDDDISKPDNRICNVPPGKSVMIQILGSHCTINDGIYTPEEYLNCAVWLNPSATISIKLDDIAIADTAVKSIYLEPVWTNFTIPDDAQGVDYKGKLKGMVAGYFLITKPLEKGSHTVEYSEKVGNLMDEDKKYSYLNYTINVG